MLKHSGGKLQLAVGSVFCPGGKKFLIDLKYSYRSVAVSSGVHFKPTRLQSKKKKIPAFHMFLTVFFVSVFFSKVEFGSGGMSCVC